MLLAVLGGGIFAGDGSVGLEGKLGKKVGARLLVQLIWAGLIAGPIFLLVSAGSAIHRIEFLRHSVRTTGTVVQLLRQTDGHGSNMYTPVFEFRDRRGNTYDTTASISSNPPMYLVGQTIPVLYEPGQPQTAMPDSFWILWFFSVLFFTFGIALIGSSLLLRYLVRRRQGLDVTAKNS